MCHGMLCTCSKLGTPGNGLSVHTQLQTLLIATVHFKALATTRSSLSQYKLKVVCSVCARVSAMGDWGLGKSQGKSPARIVCNLLNPVRMVIRASCSSCTLLKV